MKKRMALLLALLCVVTVCGCGGNAADAPADNAGITEDETEEKGKGGLGGEEASQKPEEESPGYETFSELTNTEQLSKFDIYVDVPDWYRDWAGYGIVVSNQWRVCGIVVGCSNETQPDATADDIFQETYDEWFITHGAFPIIDAAYEDYAPDIIDHVTLACGAEAIQFEGKNPGNKNFSEIESPVYGYMFLFEERPVIIGYVIKEEGDIDDEAVAELKETVDKIVQTIRTEP